MAGKSASARASIRRSTRPTREKPQPLRALRFTKESLQGTDLVYVVSRYNWYNTVGLSRHDTIGGMKKLTLSDYQALAEFRFQIRKFLRFSERAVRTAGVEPGQYQLMLAIKGMPEGVRPRIRELASRMHIQHHSAVELINRLERGGYVRRERGQDDRREVLLALTGKGERVLEELALHHHEELRSAAPGLVAALRRLMPRARKAPSSNESRG